LLLTDQPTDVAATANCLYTTII